MANHLLGSVTLGPQLGAGSFGKVFKGIPISTDSNLMCLISDMEWSHGGCQSDRSRWIELCRSCSSERGIVKLQSTSSKHRPDIRPDNTRNKA